MCDVIKPCTHYTNIHAVWIAAGYNIVARKHPHKLGNDTVQHYILNLKGSRDCSKK